MSRTWHTAWQQREKDESNPFLRSSDLILLWFIFCILFQAHICEGRKVIKRILKTNALFTISMYWGLVSQLCSFLLDFDVHKQKGGIWRFCLKAAMCVLSKLHGVMLEIEGYDYFCKVHNRSVDPASAQLSISYQFLDLDAQII